MHVSTVWMDSTMLREYLIIGDQFLWFGTMMNHSIINPNKIRELNIPVQDNNFYATVFGIEAEKAIKPLTYKGTVIRFESRVPTAW